MTPANGRVILRVLGALCAAVALAACGGTSEDPSFKSHENLPPVVVGAHDTTATVGHLLVMPYNIYDPDGDSLHVFFGIGLSLDEWADGYNPFCGLNFEGSFFWYFPAAQDGSIRMFSFGGEDARGGKTEKWFTVTVLPASTSPPAR